MIIESKDQFVPFASLSDLRRWENSNCEICSKKGKCKLLKGIDKEPIARNTINFETIRKIGYVFILAYPGEFLTVKLKTECDGKDVNSHPFCQ